MALIRRAISYPLLISLLVLALIAAGVAVVLVKKSDSNEERPYYPDLVSRSAYSCAEVNNFVDDFDPLHKWVMKFSLPSVLQQLLAFRNPFYLDVANVAYQQASAWRVVSNWTSKDGASQLYASSDPHVAGGKLKEHRHWLWRMQTDWGISIRMCLSVGVTQTNRSCLWTTPVVALDKKEDIGLLLIGIPFRARTATNVRIETLKPGEYPYANGTGFYLTNYASTARVNFKMFQNGPDRASNYYLTSNVPECNFSPFYYSPDVAAYMAFPSLQCGCSENMCLAVAKNTNASVWGNSIFKNTAPCKTLRSYWNPVNISAFVLVTHHHSSSKPLPILVDFGNTSRFTSDISSIGAPDLQKMEKLTACVEGLMNQTGNAEDMILSNCQTDVRLEFTMHGREFDQISSSVWSDEPQRNSNDPFCAKDLPEGQLQFRDKICVFRLDQSTSKEINEKIASLLNVTDVKLKHKQVWAEGAQSRSSVYTGALAAIGSMIATWFALLSRSLENIERSLVHLFQKLVSFLSRQHVSDLDQERVTGRPVGAIAQGVIFLYRAMVAVGAAGTFVHFYALCDYAGYTSFPLAVLMICTVYSSIETVNKDRDILLARTLSQTLSGGTTILVTTTATFRVAPRWTCLCLLAFLTWSLLTLVLFRIMKVVTEPRPLGLRTPRTPVRTPKTPPAKTPPKTSPKTPKQLS